MKPLSFRRRRQVSLLVTTAAIGAVAWLASREHAKLGREEVLTGSTLLATLVLLMLIGVRRRIPFWPLGSVSSWTQIHIYSGMFAGGVYLMHVPAVLAGGPLECALSLLFIIVMLSGCYGLFASRTLPKRLSAVEGQPRFDQVEWHRSQINTNAQILLEGLHEPSAMRVLGNFYNGYLQAFFARRPSIGFVVAPTSIRRKRLLSGLAQLDRYLEEDGRQTAGALAALVRRRDELDYQYALQLRLRWWVVFHSSLSLLLLTLALVHSIGAWRFLGR